MSGVVKYLTIVADGGYIDRYNFKDTFREAEEDGVVLNGIR